MVLRGAREDNPARARFAVVRARPPAGGTDRPGGTVGRAYRRRMDLIEIKQRQTLGREEAAARLRRIADHLSQHNDVEFQDGSITFRAKVPDEVHLKVEFEVGDDETELEIELTW